jgi:hypothetical protein
LERVIFVPRATCYDENCGVENKTDISTYASIVLGILIAVCIATVLVDNGFHMGYEMLNNPLLPGYYF